jgi:hypothetical protein
MSIATHPTVSNSAFRMVAGAASLAWRRSTWLSSYQYINFWHREHCSVLSQLPCPPKIVLHSTVSNSQSIQFMFTSIKSLHNKFQILVCGMISAPNSILMCACKRCEIYLGINVSQMDILESFLIFHSYEVLILYSFNTLQNTQRFTM